jgi:hypothetical protein
MDCDNLPALVFDTLRNSSDLMITTTCRVSIQVALAVDDSTNSPASLQAGDAVPGVVSCPLDQHAPTAELNPGKSWK